MCIISNPIESVSNTKILVAVNPEKNKQLTIYSNEVTNISSGNAMILPVPYPQTVTFHDLSNYSYIFKDCDSCFQSRISTNSFSADSFSADSRGITKLKVFNVGSYQVSLAMSLDEIKHVDTSVFRLSPNCFKLLSNEYKNGNFGFIICKLSDGNKDYHPFGYSHNITDGMLFIPTKHYHSHNNGSVMFNNITHNETDIVDDWSHDIYLYNSTYKNDVNFYNMSKNDFMWIKNNKLQLNKIDFDLGPLQHFEKHNIVGRKINVDLIATCVY